MNPGPLFHLNTLPLFSLLDYLSTSQIHWDQTRLLYLWQSQEIGADRWATLAITRPSSSPLFPLPRLPWSRPYLSSSVHASAGVLIVVGLLLLLLLHLPSQSLSPISSSGCRRSRRRAATPVPRSTALTYSYSISWCVTPSAPSSQSTSPTLAAPSRAPPYSG
jgi:hypothetical protein